MTDRGAKCIKMHHQWYRFLILSTLLLFLPAQNGSVGLTRLHGRLEEMVPEMFYAGFGFHPALAATRAAGADGRITGAGRPVVK
jgi:hypothetical protein